LFHPVFLCSFLLSFYESRHEFLYCILSVSNLYFLIFTCFSVISLCHFLLARHQPVILATEEAKIRRIRARSQHRQVVHKTLFQNSFFQLFIYCFLIFCSTL
jgi:drug/metabolite transporter (DMT)-like permease